MTYFLRSRPDLDGSIRVRVWTGNQFLSKDITVASIKQLTDRDSHLPLDPGVHTIIDTTEGSLFVADTTKSLLERLDGYLFHPYSEPHGTDNAPPTGFMSQSIRNGHDGWSRL